MTNTFFILRRNPKKTVYKNRLHRGTVVRCVETGKIYPSIRSAAQDLGICENSITQCCTGRSHTAGGLHWEYTETLCWTCQNCYGGCSWTEWDPQTGTPRFVPVDGWSARREMRIYGGNVDFSYHVIRCPQYISDER